MKARREHRVPLSPRCVEIIEEARLKAVGSDYLFSGRGKAPMSNMAFLMTLRRMGLRATAHGFRSAFRDWAAERTHFPREVCEAALAHTIKDKAEAAYRRGDLLERRRDLMELWAAFTASKPGEVVALRWAG
jgi:integrase